MPSDKLFIAAGACFGFLGVVTGAFGGHLLKQKLSADLLSIFEVGVRYHLIHALALILAGILYAKMQGSLMVVSGYCFMLGIFLFSGSLYALALSGVRLWGAVTPFGGLLFLTGWACLTIASLRS